MYCQECEKRLEIDTRIRSRQPLSDPAVLVQDLGRDHEATFPSRHSARMLCGGPVKKTPETKTFVSRMTFTGVDAPRPQPS